MIHTGWEGNVPVDAVRGGRCDGAVIIETMIDSLVTVASTVFSFSSFGLFAVSAAG